MADDQHVLPGLDVGAADGLQGGEGRHGGGGGLLMGEAGRFGRELVRPGAGVLGEGALRDAEHVVAGLQTGHVRTDRLDASGDLPAADPVGGRAEPIPEQAQQVGPAGHDVPDAAVEPLDPGLVFRSCWLDVAGSGAGRWPGGGPGCSPKIIIRSVSSVRTVNTRRSAKQFARRTTGRPRG